MSFMVVAPGSLALGCAEHATLMPAYLAAVSKQLPLECAILAEAAKAMPPRC
jgi:hypothetical protein